MDYVVLCFKMRRKYSKGRRSKIATKSLSGKREETKVVEKIVQVVHRTPTKSSDYERYLQDEKWDILPKTDYTYARTGSYSPRFLGRKWVDPNMSRYRIRYKGGARSDVDYDGYLSSEYSDDDRVASEDLQDSDSDISYERVLEDGIELRSGKSLKTMKEILNEHDEKLQQSDIMQSTNRHAYTTSKLETKTRSRKDVYNVNKNAQTRSSSKKLENQQGNNIWYTQSEQKHGRYSDVGPYQQSDFEYGNVDYSGVRSRKNLSADFSNSTKRVQKKSNGLDVNSFKSKSDRDEVDNRTSRSRYSMRTVTNTLTEEFIDSNRDVTEKGSIEVSEKASRPGRTSGVHSTSNNVNLYGLDSDGEFSDTDTISTKRSSYSTSSNSRYGGYSDGSTGSTATVTTVVTTITETISIFTNPVWNHVVRPVLDHVVRPFTSIVMSVLYFTWLLLSQPLIYIVQSVGHLCSWLWSSKFEEIMGGVAHSPLWLLHKIKHVTWQLILMDSWLFKRRNGRRCCLCLPLLLLLPFLLMFFKGYDTWSSDRYTVLSFFNHDKTFVPITLADSEKHEYFTQLNAEVKNMILQLQTNQQQELLTAADVEAIVHRIVAKENADLKSTIQGSQNEALVNQAQWKLDQEAKLSDMQGRHNVLVASIDDLVATIVTQKAIIAGKDSNMREHAAQDLSGLEEKLAALHLELQELKKAHAALLMRVNACCHNETYYSAAVKDNVNTILAEMMSGHMSGNPSQDAFTEWLHSNYVSRGVLDERLKDLASDLTSNVLTMIKDLQNAQLQQYQHLEKQQQELQNSQQSVHVTASGAGVGEQQVRQMIEEALFRYSADKTGIADYALESAGGVVLSTRCSESYYRKTALVSIFGVPLWYTSNSPRTVIQPEVYPGQCWAFKGPEGYLVIKTSTTVTPSGFTLEHIPKSLAPSGEIDSAPKEFTVLGLHSEYDDAGISLGNYTYDDNGKPMQFFSIQVKEDVKPFSLYELRIRSNYGNLEYTCLYRFRIHGKPYRR